MGFGWDNGFHDCFDPWNDDFFDDSARKKNTFENDDRFADCVPNYNKANMFESNNMKHHHDARDNFTFWFIELF